MIILGLVMAKTEYGEITDLDERRREKVLRELHILEAVERGRRRRLRGVLKGGKAYGSEMR